MKILIVSTSLNPESRSRALAERAREYCTEAGADTCLVDLHDLRLPFSGPTEAYEHPEAMALADRVREADGIIVASPIYNYDVNAACKNMLELTGDAWENKIVGFVCAAGGHGSFMSIMGLANSLMLDFRCVVVPRFVFALGGAFREGVLIDPEIQRRVERLVREILRFAGALGGG